MCRHDRLEVANSAGFVASLSKPATVPGTSERPRAAWQIRVPNITGSTSWDVNGLGKANLGYSSCGSSRVSNSGAMSVTAGSYWACIGSSGGDFNGNNAVVNINARSSNSTYGSSSVVQPSSTRLLFCIKI